MFEFDREGRQCVGRVLDTPVGDEGAERVPLVEGQVLQVGATETMVAEITFEWGRSSAGNPSGSHDGPAECGNPACGALGPVGGQW